MPSPPDKMCVIERSRRPNVHAESFCRLPHSIIQAEKPKSPDGRTTHQKRGEVNRVQGPNRFARKRLTGSIDDLRGNPQNLPVSSRGGQVSTPVSSLGFRQFFERHRAQQYSVAFNQREI